MDNRKRSRRWVMLALFAVPQLVALSTSPHASLSGIVLDSEGAAIRQAHIIVRTDSSGTKSPSAPTSDVMLESDHLGRFQHELEFGFYDICVMANGFSPQCRKIYLSRDTPKMEFRLRADPEVIKRLGDQVFE